METWGAGPAAPEQPLGWSTSGQGLGLAAPTSVPHGGGAWLWVESGGQPAAPFALAAPIIRIGRSDHAAGYAPDLDLNSDPYISRRHLEIRRGEDVFEIVDCGSANGTAVNGEWLTPGT